MSFAKLIGMQERGHRNVFLGFLVAHDRHADAAVRMAAAAQLSPIRRRPVNQVGEIGEGAHEADGEPVANGFANADLVLHVVRQMRKRVALRLAAFVGDGFVAPGEGNGLERKERNLLGII